MIIVETTLGGQDATIYAPSAETFDPLVFRAVFPSGQMYGLDVEGTYMDALGQWSSDFGLRLIQFATVGYAWVLDLFDPAQRVAAIELLSDKSVGFCSHSNMDVLSVATRLGVDISSRNVDTRVLANMAYTDKYAKHDLKTLTSELIGPELGEAQEVLHTLFKDLWTGKKNVGKAVIEKHGWSSVPSTSKEYVTYAGLDAIACRRLVELLVPMTGAPTRLLEIETWLAGEANRLQLRGMLIDQPGLDSLCEEAEAATSAPAERVKELTDGLLVRSPKMHGWLADHGADWSRWVEMGGALTETGKPSVSKEKANLLLQFDLDEVGMQVAQAWLEFKNYEDRLNKTRGFKKHLAPDGRLHPVLNTVGATTSGRMSSSDPNVQNVSKKDTRTRGIFIPEPGHVMVSCDFDQVELRVAAALARESVMIEAILRGDDLHQLTADAIGRPRPIGKMTNFLIVYGGGANALHDQGGIPVEDAREAVTRFRDAYPALSDLAERMGGYTRDIRTVTGRRLEVGTFKDGGSRAYANINYLIQSSARDLLVQAWHRFGVEFGRADMVWLPIHDELVLHVPESELDVVTKEIEESMTFEFYGVPITASATVLRDENGVSRWGK